MGYAMKADGAFIGQDMSVTPLIGKLRLHIQGYADKEDFFISPLKHEDVILGALWSDRLAASIKFPKRKMSFKFKEMDMYINAQELGSTIRLVNDQAFDKPIKSSISAYMILVKDFLNGVNETQVNESGMQEDLELSNSVNQFQDVFIDDTLGELPPKRGDDDHMIELIPGSSPSNKPPYRVSQAQQEEIMRQVNELVEKGMVRPRSSPFCSPVLLVQKKDGTYQVMDDYFLAVGIAPENQAMLSMFRLLEDAQLWWKQHCRDNPTSSPSWEKMKQAVKERYLPPAHQALKMNEFYALRQLGLTLEEYYSKFVSLRRSGRQINNENQGQADLDSNISTKDSVNQKLNIPLETIVEDSFSDSSSELSYFEMASSSTKVNFDLGPSNKGESFDRAFKHQLLFLKFQFVNKLNAKIYKDGMERYCVKVENRRSDMRDLGPVIYSGDRYFDDQGFMYIVVLNPSIVDKWGMTGTKEKVDIESKETPPTLDKSNFKLQRVNDMTRVNTDNIFLGLYKYDGGEHATYYRCEESLLKEVTD
ncbi:hypothetical protein L7F22_063399 [Adiantum nelumboides]|nr:hypothetical protein [Adiantum nelumboides]